MSLKTAALFGILLTTLVACSTENTLDDVPTTGTLDITVYNASDDTALTAVQLLVFADEDDTPLSDVIISDADGKAELILDVGKFYYLKAAAQNFESSPPPNLSANRFAVSAGQTTFSTIRLNPIDPLISAGNGSLSGTLSDPAAAGALVVASGLSGQAYSTRVDSSGNYTLFNLPADTYTVNAWIANFSSDSATDVVAAGAETTNINLTISPAPLGTVSGTLTPDSNITTEISPYLQLAHPLTGESIPGLKVKSENNSYAISGVADGDYLARASHDNDGYIMAPYWIAQNGQPQVTVSGNAVTQDFTLTRAATINGPTNVFSRQQPKIVDSTTPAFSWSAYTDATDYVIEVSDLDGNVLWGGFSPDYTSRVFSIAADTLSVTYNQTEIDSSGTPLEDGKIYRWRLYVTKDTDENGYDPADLVSASEPQLGLFKVVVPVAP